MAKTWVIPVGYDLDIDMKVGDGLFLVFCAHRRFCVTFSSANIFPGEPYPNGAQTSGTIWPSNGAPAIAREQGTIIYTSIDPAHDCPKLSPEAATASLGGGHSIQIGG